MSACIVLDCAAEAEVPMIVGECVPEGFPLVLQPIEVDHERHAQRIVGWQRERWISDLPRRAFRGLV